MPLLLTIENADQFGSDIQSKFAPQEGRATIGRAVTADWCLPDTSRFLSGIHCEIVSENDGYALIDRSRNGVILNGHSLAPDEVARLTSGDRIILGPFNIRVAVGDGPQPEADTDGDKTTIVSFQSIAKATPGIAEEIKAKTVAPRAKPAPSVVSTEPRPKKVSPRPATGTGDFSTSFIQQFAEGAGLDPDDLAGRTDAEFARNLGEMMRVIIPAIAGLSRSAAQLRDLIGSEVRQRNEAGIFDDQNVNSLRRLFGSDQVSEQPLVHGLELALSDLAEHDEAMFMAMQTALFELLNTIAPTQIERSTGSGMFRSRKRRNWDAYLGQWDEMNNSGENGLLDAFLARFRAAYDGRLLGD